MMRKSWEKNSGIYHFYIDVYPGNVVVGHDCGTGQSDIAGECTHAEFLAGRFHGLIVDRFGPDVLQEVIRVVNNQNPFCEE
jgi:hypothetical protein